MNPRAAVFLAALFLACGCGYSLKGQTSNLPRDIRRIAIPPVKNSTTETRLANTLTNELIRQFSLSRIVRVTNVDAADAVLEAHIKSVRIEGAAVTVARDASMSRRAIVTVDASLKRKDNGRTLWQAGRLVETRTFDVTAEQTTTDINVNDALTRIARDLAEKIHDGTFESF